MKKLIVKKRHPLRQKDVKKISEILAARYGESPLPEDELVEVGNTELGEVILYRGVPFCIELDGEYIPTLKGLLSMDSARLAVTVDMGAVKFIHNGADIMAAGIVDADASITVGDIVWVRDERNKKPLAVGKALMSGEDMALESAGKAVKSLHYVGDDLWSLKASKSK